MEVANNNRLIRNTAQAAQVVDYSACAVDKNYHITNNKIIAPSDVDGFLEQHITPYKTKMKYEKAFLFIEHKTFLPNRFMCGMPKGQLDSYVSLVDALSEAKQEDGRPKNFALLIECYHEPPKGDVIKSHECLVAAVYVGEHGKWFYPSGIMLPEMVLKFYRAIGLREKEINEEEKKILSQYRGITNE